MSRDSEAAGRSPIVIALLAGILVALVALVVLVGISLRHSPSANPSTSATGSIGSGETRTNREMQAAGVPVPPPPKPVTDTSRIKETYPPGSRYRLVGKVALRGRASDKDWGVETVENLCYAGEVEVVRTIEKNDGTTLVETREFRRARTVSVFAHLEDVRVDLGPAGALILDLLDLYTGQLGQYSAINGASAKSLLQTIPGIQALADKLSTDEATKVVAFVDRLQGKQVRITYVNGQGVTTLTPLNGSLDADEQGFLLSVASLSDAYALPDLHSQEGQEWTVDAQQLVPILDPTLRARATGLVGVRQGPIVTENGKHTTTLAVLSGSAVELVATDQESETLAHWYPQGTLVFSFDDKIVTEGHLSGHIQLQQRSTNHILFEARHTLEPDYQVTYSCERLK